MKKESLQQIVLQDLDIHMQKHETRSLCTMQTKINYGINI